MHYADSKPSLTPGEYLRNIFSGVWTTLVGMSITIKYFFTRPVTYQYPEEKMPVADRYRGIHYLEQDLCIACRVCEKACPIDCIIIRFTRQPGNVNEWYEFTLDYNKCMFCELCCYPCPKDCIHMSKDYSLVKYNRSELVFDLLSWKDMRPEDKAIMDKAAEEKAKKAAEEAAKKAAAVAAGGAKPAAGAAPKPAAPAAGAPAKPAAPAAPGGGGAPARPATQPAKPTMPPAAPPKPSEGGAPKQ